MICHKTKPTKPRCTLIQCVVPVRVSSMDQIDLFKNWEEYLKKNLWKNNCTEYVNIHLDDVHDFLTSWHKITRDELTCHLNHLINPSFLLKASTGRGDCGTLYCLEIIREAINPFADKFWIFFLPLSRFPVNQKISK